MTQCTGQEAFATTGGAGDQQVLALIQVAAFGQRGQLLFGQVAGRTALDLFERSG